MASAALPWGGAGAWAETKAKVRLQPAAEQQLRAKGKKAKTRADQHAKAAAKPKAKPLPPASPKEAKALAKTETAAGHPAVSVAALTPPTLSSRDLAGSGLTLVLGEADVARYRVIFQLQESADWKGADDIIAKLRDPGLAGHVLAHRYLHPQYRSSYAELHLWMDQYHDHPDARRIYELAKRRRTKNAKAPHEPTAPEVAAARSIGIDVQAYDRQAFEAKSYEPRRKLGATDKREYQTFIDKLNWTLRKGTQAQFRKLLLEDKARALLHPGEYDRQVMRLAQGFYAVGNDQQAHFWAEQAAKRSGEQLPEANWTAGLAAWRLGKLDDAAHHFEAVSRSEYSSRWLASAGAFWAARAHLKLRRPKEFVRLASLAAENPRTFYGLLARRLQNRDPEFTWSPASFDREALKELNAAPGGRRAVMLLQIGDEIRAERELRALSGTGKTSKGLTEAMIALADRAQMPSLAMRLGNMLVRNGSPITDATAYPAPQLTPAAGEIIDRELVLALVRQESGFNPNARSPAGARGLMQLMPDTAAFVAKDAKMGGRPQRRLYEPEVNLMLGQRYIDILMKEAAISGDLFRMVTAWNAGPGNLAKWMKSVKHQDDPLLFIESIPSKETRNFAERVLTNYWIYRQRFNQPTNSLHAVAQGKWPTYHSDKSDQVEIAEDERRKK